MNIYFFLYLSIWVLAPFIWIFKCARENDEDAAQTGTIATTFFGWLWPIFIVLMTLFFVFWAFYEICKRKV